MIYNPLLLFPTMDTIKYPLYLKRKLIYEAKRFAPYKCRIDFKSDGTADIIYFGNNNRNNGARNLLKQIIEEQMVVYEEDLKKFKQGLDEPHAISEKVLDVAQVEFNSSSHAPIQVASYLTNFATSKPFIVIPASPASYQKPRLPFDITSTSTDEQSHSDVNKELFKHPLEPMLIACQNLIQDFSLANYDVLTDRNNLRKLLSWAMQEEKSLFRVDFELCNGCLVLRRCDEEQSESNASTHSSASLFEQKCVKKSNHVAYHIISSFKLGNNKVLMRYEVDGRMPPKNSEDEITAQLGSTSLNDEKEVFKDSDVPFIVQSKQQEQIEYVELKTFMKDRYNLTDHKFKSELSSIYFQSFIAGVNRFVFGLKESVYLGRGNKRLQATKIVEETLGSLEPHVDVAKMTGALKKVIALLNYVHNKMKDGVAHAALLYDPKADQLLFYRRTANPLIPPHFPFTK